MKMGIITIMDSAPLLFVKDFFVCVLSSKCHVQLGEHGVGVSYGPVLID